MSPQKPLTVSPTELDLQQIARLIDHTFLLRPEHFDFQARDNFRAGRPNSSAVALNNHRLQRFVEETVRLIQAGVRPYALCLFPEDIPYAKECLASQGITDVLLAAVVGFPDGNKYPIRSKVMRTEEAIAVFGAQEIDVVIAYDKLRSGRTSDYRYLADELQAVVDAARNAASSGSSSSAGVVKAIIEESQLIDRSKPDPLDLIKRACEIAEHTGVDFVKTSTGFALPGATLPCVRVMRKHFSRGIKCAGGLTKDNLVDFLVAASGNAEGHVVLDPMYVRAGTSGYLTACLDSGNPNAPQPNRS